MIIFGAILVGSCCCSIICFCLYRAFKTSSRQPSEAVVVAAAPLTVPLATQDNVSEEGEGKVYATNMGSDAKDIHNSTAPIPDWNEKKENTYIMNVSSDVKQLGLTFTDGVVSKCVPGGYANTCNVSIGHTLISANDHDFTEFSCSDFLEVLRARPLKLVFSKPPINMSV